MKVVLVIMQENMKPSGPLGHTNAVEFTKKMPLLTGCHSNYFERSGGHQCQSQNCLLQFESWTGQPYQDQS